MFQFWLGLDDFEKNILQAHLYKKYFVHTTTAEQNSCKALPNRLTYTTSEKISCILILWEKNVLRMKGFEKKFAPTANHPTPPYSEVKWSTPKSKAFNFHIDIFVS